MHISRRTLRYGAFEGVVVSQQAEKGPGILLLPDGWGVSTFAIEQAERFSAGGCVCLVGDLHGGGLTALDTAHTGRLADAALADPNRMRATASAGLTALRGLHGVDGDRIAVVGYCLGGAYGLELARSGADFAALVTFHGLLRTHRPAAAGRIKPSLLVCSGSQDPFVPLEDMLAFQREMIAAEADCQIHIFTQAGHSFTKPDADTNRPGVAYHQSSADRSISLACSFLEQKLCI